MGRAGWRGVGSGVVLGEDAGAVVGGEDEDGIDREEGHVGRHGGGKERAGEDSTGAVLRWSLGVVADRSFVLDKSFEAPRVGLRVYHTTLGVDTVSYLL